MSPHTNDPSGVAFVSDDSPRYAISDVAEMTGISAFTLRYYDKCGFFPHLMRTKGNMRRFSDRDLFDLRIVDALRRSGLSIEGIQYFFRLGVRGAEGRAEQLAILRERQSVLEYQRDEITAGLEALQDAIDLTEGQIAISGRKNVSDPALSSIIYPSEAKTAP